MLVKIVCHRQDYDGFVNMAKEMKDRHAFVILDIDRLEHLFRGSRIMMSCSVSKLPMCITYKERKMHNLIYGENCKLELLKEELSKPDYEIEVGYTVYNCKETRNRPRMEDFFRLRTQVTKEGTISNDYTSSIKTFNNELFTKI